jgi:signal peptidase I
MLSISMAFHLSTKGLVGIIVGRAVLSRKNAVSGIVSIRRAARLPSGGAAIALATLLALTAKVFLVDLAVVDGHSMEPSFSRGSIVLVVRCAYGIRLPGSLGLYWFRWSEPCPGDVVLAFPKASGKRVIKRVMAVGPEAKGWNGPGDCLKKELLPEEIFLLGDNPEESRDSREYGPVRMGDIAGRVVRLRL